MGTTQSTLFILSEVAGRQARGAGSHLLTLAGAQELPPGFRVKGGEPDDKTCYSHAKLDRVQGRKGREVHNKDSVLGGEPGKTS